MSLVAYGSSDESSDEEVTSDQNVMQKTASNETVKSMDKVDEIIKPQNPTTPKIHMNLPVPKHNEKTVELNDSENTLDEQFARHTIQFEALPKPRHIENDYKDIVEDDDIPLFKPEQFTVEKPVKKDRAPVKISIPALSEFKDVDEDMEKSKNARQPSMKGTGLFAILPPPKGTIVTKKNNLIPHVLTKAHTKAVHNKPTQISKVSTKSTDNTSDTNNRVKEKTSSLAVLGYESNSEDEEESGSPDFFSLSKPVTPTEPPISVTPNFFSVPEDNKVDKNPSTENYRKINENTENASKTLEFVNEVEETPLPLSEKTLISTVMNLPRDEILLKNKAEVGPKLPVPEQEFNVDAEGNVAFDEKAIEYLCGKRGVKRKNQMIDEANIIEINGEDIKPDEREWLVKALTEEPVQRPVSMQGAGPSSQSKKKHQITYLAHQAKAMEVELKNTWSQNRMARKQTQSKYGF